MSPYYQEGLLDEKLGSNHIGTNHLHLFAICWRELFRNHDVGDFLGGYSGPQNRRLRPIKVEDFDSELETPAKESGLPSSFFTRMVHAFGVIP
jgi:hypothetical protein